jgi:hypothetical protein
VISYKIPEEWEEEWDGYFKHFVNPIKIIVTGPKDNERTRYVTKEEAKKLSRFYRNVCSEM